MTINDPAIVAELAALYPRYETALVTNDVPTLVEMFWTGPQVMRFGVTENVYGPGELEAFRKWLSQRGRTPVEVIRRQKVRAILEIPPPTDY